ncbi:MAG: hypothetical protein IJ848_00555 [Alphaproteobacteria bacterium]|nr:hypothetical protein [Alphaproteobacteria bacterium]
MYNDNKKHSIIQIAKTLNITEQTLHDICTKLNVKDINGQTSYHDILSKFGILNKKGKYISFNDILHDYFEDGMKNTNEKYNISSKYINNIIDNCIIPSKNKFLSINEIIQTIEQNEYDLKTAASKLEISSKLVMYVFLYYGKVQ